MSPFRGLMLTTSQRAEHGYTAQATEVEETLVGRKGKAVTVLRPVGKAEFGDDVLVVETDGEFIQSGAVSPLYPAPRARATDCRSSLV